MHTFESAQPVTLDFTSTKVKFPADLLDAVVTRMVAPTPGILLDGWGEFNKRFGGFRLGEFTILCAATGSGKTALLANWSSLFLLNNQKHVVFSVETGPHDFIARVMSAMMGRNLTTGDPVSVAVLEHFQKEYLKYFTTQNLALGLYENRIPIETLVAELKLWNSLGYKLFMIDNLNFFMEVKRSADAIIEMDRVVHILVMLCKEIGIHIIMVMHPKKTDGANGRIESEFDVKGSSTSVQESSNVLLMNRPKQEDIDKKNRSRFDRELKFAKIRARGDYAGSSIWLNFNEGKYHESK